jgi:hypothetical protein
MSLRSESIFCLNDIDILSHFLIRVWDSTKWEAEFNQFMTSFREDDLDYDFSAAMQEAFQSGDQSDFQNKSSHQRFDEEGLPILTAYSFGALQISSLCMFT